MTNALSERVPANGGTQESGLATVADAMKFLQVSRTCLYGLMDHGELDSLKVGRCRRIRWADLHRFIGS